jgi:hypothetical protein
MDVVAQLQDWEQRFPVDEWRLDGLRVWPLLRNELAGALSRALGGPAVTRRGGLGGVGREAVAAFRAGAAHVRDAQGRQARIGRADAVFVSHPANRDMLDGVAVDRFFDPMADALADMGASSVHLEYSRPDAPYKVPRRRPSVFITPALLACRLRARMARSAKEAAILPGHAEFWAAARTRFPFLRPPSARRLLQRVRHVELLAGYFGGLLEHAQAKCALVTNYNNSIGMALCLAAARAGVTSVDVQHGITRRNAAYEGWSRFPSGGYELLPRRFWVWSEHDAEPLAGWPAAGRAAHVALVGGNPWLLFWAEPSRLAADAAEKVKALPRGRITVLVTLSWSGGLSEEIRSILLRSPPDIVWWIRLHPVMRRETSAIAAWCAEHAPATVRVAEPTELPLPLLLRHVQVHLTEYSAVVQEALAAGVPSVVISERAKEYFPAELASSWVHFAPAADAAVAALEAQARAAAGRHGRVPTRSDMTAALRSLLGT